ncbi:MAG: carbamoyltransferase HypF [Gammaproteobacteria bacterium]|nr:carbamoyltransferase HypF [Gammaproteobacteria bacterium]MBU1653490.1 carbamoyltransferase HypF [Gammaproteobacteria bacterium]MBU1962731.1 carbamoyltransferase HypF [Gammaproteobacteria bacterium]
MYRHESIRVRGLVQGVGFRPTVWRHALAEGIRGSVCNDGEGVLIQAWGEAGQLERLVARILADPPPLARIEAIERTPLPDRPPGEGFRIIGSSAGETRTAIAADAATCPQCLAEVFDPADRRFRYPFTNCTHCGPRLSIIAAVPYDRANTSMAAFRQCPRCQAEYEDPSDRRFHAQPNACPVCGPRLWLENGAGQRLEAGEGRDAIGQARVLLERGHILAIKGIGGFHLACDARNEKAVADLRQRKGRYHKAFALMAGDLAVIGRYAQVSGAEAELLQDKAAPIVILDRAGERLPEGIAPGQNGLGFMLPYSPLHHLLLHGLGWPIVLTSGNRSEEPQCTGNAEARERLHGIADFFLLHDREILNRLDDSVLRWIGEGRISLRRARGYAPEALRLPAGFEGVPQILAMGGELKNAFCLVKEGRAVLSQHIGDLEEAATLRDYRHNLGLYRRLFDCRPALIAVDGHPDYGSTLLGRTLAQEAGLPLVEVQHHHAHIAAGMAEHGIPRDTGPVLGIALDGIGMGDDGSLWGGEFLLAGYAGYKRLAHFRPVPLLGGAKAMREPWRNTLAHLWAALGWERVEADYAGLEIVRYLKNKPLANLRLMAERGINSPPASSCGRLFDALAAALGVCREYQGFEGQAAMALETLAEPCFEAESGRGYPYRVEVGPGPLQLDWAPLWERVLGDLEGGVGPGVIAARFHQGLARAVAETASLLSGREGVDTLVLSGGVFQNRLLLLQVVDLLRGQGLRVLFPQQIPANDGGISLGQALVAAARGI